MRTMIDADIGAAPRTARAAARGTASIHSTRPKRSTFRRRAKASRPRPADASGREREIGRVLENQQVTAGRVLRPVPLRRSGEGPPAARHTRRLELPGLSSPIERPGARGSELRTALRPGRPGTGSARCVKEADR